MRARRTDWRAIGGARLPLVAGLAHALRSAGPCPRCVCMRVSAAGSAPGRRPHGTRHLGTAAQGKRARGQRRAACHSGHTAERRPGSAWPRRPAGERVREEEEEEEAEAAAAARGRPNSAQRGPAPGEAAAARDGVRRRRPPRRHFRVAGGPRRSAGLPPTRSRAPMWGGRAGAGGSSELARPSGRPGAGAVPRLHGALKAAVAAAESLGRVLVLGREWSRCRAPRRRRPAGAGEAGAGGAAAAARRRRQLPTRSDCITGDGSASRPSRSLPPRRPRTRCSSRSCSRPSCSPRSCSRRCRRSLCSSWRPPAPPPAAGTGGSGSGRGASGARAPGTNGGGAAGEAAAAGPKRLRSGAVAGGWARWWRSTTTWAPSPRGWWAAARPAAARAAARGARLRPRAAAAGVSGSGARRRGAGDPVGSTAAAAAARRSGTGSTGGGGRRRRSRRGRRRAAGGARPPRPPLSPAAATTTPGARTGRDSRAAEAAAATAAGRAPSPRLVAAGKSGRVKRIAAGLKRPKSRRRLTRTRRRPTATTSQSPRPTGGSAHPPALAGTTAPRCIAPRRACGAANRWAPWAAARPSAPTAAAAPPATAGTVPTSAAEMCRPAPTAAGGGHGAPTVPLSGECGPREGGRRKRRREGEGWRRGSWTVQVSRCLATKALLLALLLLLGWGKGGKWRSSCPDLGRKEIQATLLFCSYYMF